MQTELSTEQYATMLKAHDWYYSSSDDPRVYNKGLEEEKVLKKLYHLNPNFKAMYESEFSKHFKTIFKV
jgi:hypothetical protein